MKSCKHCGNKYANSFFHGKVCRVCRCISRRKTDLFRPVISELGEEWRDVSINTLYKVSNFGRIASFVSPIPVLMRLNKLKSGYLTVSVGGRWRSVHRLVALAFHPNPDNKPCVNHLDGDKSNNNDWNLKWATHSENTIHAFETGLIRSTNKGKYGVRSNTSKLIYQFDASNRFVKHFYGAREAERSTGIKYSSITNVCNNKRKTAGGFKWKYITPSA